jgi:acyl-CoA dehydrogenase
VVKTAWLMDTVGKGAHTEIQTIRIATPRTVGWIAGVSRYTPLAAP